MVIGLEVIREEKGFFSTAILPVYASEVFTGKIPVLFYSKHMRRRPRRGRPTHYSLKM